MKSINELFESLLTSYQEALENEMKGSDFVFDDVNGLRYLCHIIYNKFKSGWVICKFY